MLRPLPLRLAAVATFFSLLPTGASAQHMDARAEELRAHAEEAYFEMEMDQALRHVDEALSLCMMGCSDEKRAALKIMRGMILFIAKDDAESARAHFEEALELDADAKLDRMLTNPSLERLFAQVKARALDPYAKNLGDEALEAEGEAESAGREEGAKSAPRRKWNRVFLEAGYSITGATVHSGMRADSPPSLGAGGDPQADSIPENDAYILSGTHGCGAPPGGYCVRANRGLLAMTHGLHIGAGVFVSEKFAISARVRFSPNAGAGVMSNLLVGVRGHYQLTEQKLRGFHASFFAGVMVGQIQLQPKQAPAFEGAEIERPWVRTGMGGFELGLKLGHRFSPNVGIYASPELYALVPDFSAGAQITAGLDVAFGATEREVPGDSP